MARIRRRPAANWRGRQDYDVVVTIFIVNPERAFSREEIVREVQQRHPSISESRIENIRQRLYRERYIRHETEGGPYEKRYIYTGKKWDFTPPPTRSRPCEPATLPQWRELQRARQPIVSTLARCAPDDDSATVALRDALLESELDALAEHFEPCYTHDKCWALPILAGTARSEQLELTTKQAAAWLGIGEDQLYRIAEIRKVRCLSHKTFIRGNHVRRKSKWSPADIGNMIDDPKVIAFRRV
jgi:hypothetical protein